MVGDARDFPGGFAAKNLPANVGDAGSIPGLGRCPGEENGNPLQCFCLGNPMDRGAWQATPIGLQRVGHDLATKQQTGLDFNLKSCDPMDSGSSVHGISQAKILERVAISFSRGSS